jgi:cytochrome b
MEQNVGQNPLKNVPARETHEEFIDLILILLLHLAAVRVYR